MSDSHLEDYLHELIFVRKLSNHSVMAYKQDILLLRDWLAAQQCALPEANKHMLRAFIHARSKLGEHTATLNRRISSLRGYYAYLVRQKRIPHDPAISLHNFKIQKHLPPLFHADHLQSLLNFPVETFLDRRDQVLYEFLYSTGCRISECLALDYIEVQGVKRIPVKGKGDKMRVVFITRILQEKLSSYLEERQAHLSSLGKQDTQALFINYKGDRLTRTGAAYTLSRRLLQLGIDSATLHSFRHSFATDLLDNGLDVRIVQELMGHSSVSTTQRYTHLSRRNIVEMYHNAHPRAHK